MRRLEAVSRATLDAVAQITTHTHTHSHKHLIFSYILMENILQVLNEIPHVSVAKHSSDKCYFTMVTQFTIKRLHYIII
jgi:hypothetical protein